VFSVLAVVNEEGQRCSDRKHSDEWNQFTELASSLFYFFLSHGPIDLQLLSYRYRIMFAHQSQSVYLMSYIEYFLTFFSTTKQIYNELFWLPCRSTCLSFISDTFNCIWL